MNSKRLRVGGEKEYDSDFEEEEDEEKLKKKEKRHDLAHQPGPSHSRAPTHAAGLPGKGVWEAERGRADAFKHSYLGLNAYERHKKLINDYYLYYPGAKSKLQRDGSRDKNDQDIIRDHHRFIWDEDEDADTWEKQIAKKYYDKLFKEYCICDLSYYQQGKYAMRWRTDTEVINGKGQFICGARKCETNEGLKTWEVNFAYMEDSVKKNALVKLRLCPECSVKLNYHQKRKEVTKTSKKKKKKDKSHKNKKRDRKRKHSEQSSSSKSKSGDEEGEAEGEPDDSDKSATNSNVWKDPVQLPDAKTREEEFDDYLDDLFL